MRVEDGGAHNGASTQHPAIQPLPSGLSRDAGTPRAVATPVLPAPRDARRAAPTAGADVRLPNSAEGCREWAGNWVVLCKQRPGFARGEEAISEDDAQRLCQRGVRAVQLIRAAATGGKLRDRAVLLGVAVPDDYVDMPAPELVRVS